MKNKKTVVILAAVLVVLAAAAAVIWKFALPAVQKGEKQITVTVVDSDKKEKTHKIDTDAEYLGEALYEEKLVNEEEYKSGFYTEIDGEKADYDKDKAFWWIKRNGEDASVGANELPVADGDEFEITYTVG